ncbi:MAG: PAS domain-containing protein [Alphaproteobacteria bacterium]
MSRTVKPTGVERFFDAGSIIVSKTNLTGHITYANRTFIEVAGFTEAELIGAPHSILRHPDMPRCVFKLLWDTLAERHEIFAYVVNLTKNGDHYWVFAHVTPSVDGAGSVVGYHSSRRVPDRGIVEGTIMPLYAQLKAEEDRHADRKAGMAASYRMLAGLLAEKGIGYDELIFSL